MWQVLPLVPTHTGDGSPYNSLSVMAGNPALISAGLRASYGMEREEDLSPEQRAQYDVWCARQAGWLEAYVEFSVLRDLHDGVPWQQWEPALRDREPAAVAAVLADHDARVRALRLEQWVFDEQWRALRTYAASRGVLLFGDLPIFVSLDSADVWAAREQFLLDARGPARSP